MVRELATEGVIAATIVAQAAAGDAVAFARIVEAHHDDMARVCFVVCGDQDMAQDAVQAAGRSPGASFARSGSRICFGRGW